jgi:hypothetical protein
LNDQVKDEMGRACSLNGGEKCIQDNGGKARKKDAALGRPRCRWVDSIKMDLREIGWGGSDWIDLV